MNKVRIKIVFKSFDSRVLDKFVKEVVISAKRNGGVVNGPIFLPNRTSRYIVNRSPHCHKKSREQFEIVRHKRLMEISSLGTQLMQMLSNLLLPAGVHAKVSVVE